MKKRRYLAKKINVNKASPWNTLWSLAGAQHEWAFQFSKGFASIKTP
jgi:hypothetical protein